MSNQSPFSISNILKSSNGKQTDFSASPGTNRTVESNDFQVTRSFPQFNPTSHSTNLPSESEKIENRQEESPGVLRARNRNSRVPFTRKQVERLEAIFDQTNYLSGREVTEVARELQISESRVKIWFQNRRARKRREYNLREMATLSLYPGQTNPSDFLQNVHLMQPDGAQESRPFQPFFPKDWFRDSSL
ncbi:unnamed protein product [Hymenolepis diminuta]|nr:unnamed protein product [Hymenolepis diminuta]